MDSEQPRIDVEFHIAEVSNKFLRQLTQTINATKHIYHAVDNYNPDFIPPLETDTLPIVIIDPSDPNNTKPTKAETLLWLYKKAFEEFIIGLTESLIEAYRLLKISRLSVSTKLKRDKTDVQIMEEITKINDTAMKMFFPNLLNEIEKELEVALLFKNELISINCVRNCLVHRSGIVKDKDINDEANKVLKLMYFQYKTYSELEGQKTEMNWDRRKAGVQATGLEIVRTNAVLNFPLNSNVYLNDNNFNDVACTCAFFVYYLLEVVQKKTIELGGVMTNPINDFHVTIG
ncbi:MAG: hypothetical protein ACLQQ4_18030 [Bacteroidia bacterium]